MGYASVLLMASSELPTAGLHAIAYADVESRTSLYRGHPMDELADGHRFTEAAFLFIYGRLPSAKELQLFERGLADSSELAPALQGWLSQLSPETEPTAALVAAVLLLPNQSPADSTEGAVTQILAQSKNVVAWWLNREKGEGSAPPGDVAWSSALLNTLGCDGRHLPLSRCDEILNRLLILQTDYEPSGSTSAVRAVAGSGASLHACLAAAVCAFSGSQEGGESVAVVRMLEALHRRQGNAEQLLKQVREGGYRLPGFGHSLFTQQDPRASLLKCTAYDVMGELNERDSLFGLAAELEHVVLEAPYFQARNMYANIHFYNAIIYRALGVPTSMFTPMGVLGRLPAWIAHVLQVRELEGPPNSEAAVLTSDVGCDRHLGVGLTGDNEEGSAR